MVGRMCVVDQMRHDTLPKGSPGGKDPVMGSRSATGQVGEYRLSLALLSSPIWAIERLTAPLMSSSANLCTRVFCKQGML